MAALVDTAVVIDHLRGRSAASELIRTELLSGEPVLASVLTRAELLAGLRPRERPRLTSLLESLIWIDVTVSIADRAGVFASRYARSHRNIDMVDYVVAATCEELDVPLWTLNVRHFPMIKGLRAPY